MCTVSCTRNLRRNRPTAEKLTFSDRLVQGCIGIQTQTIRRFVHTCFHRHDCWIMAWLHSLYEFVQGYGTRIIESMSTTGFFTPAAITCNNAYHDNGLASFSLRVCTGLWYSYNREYEYYGLFYTGSDKFQQCGTWVTDFHIFF